MYKILLESQVKEKPIAYTKWEKCLKKDRMHTLTSEEARRFAHDTHIPSILSTTGCLRFSPKFYTISSKLCKDRNVLIYSKQIF